MRLTALLAVLCGCGWAQAFYTLAAPSVSAYYADAVSGADTNDCKSPATACKTIAHLASIDAGSPRGRWRLMAGTGELWRETLTLPRSAMTLDVYGGGARPVIDGSDAIPASAWSLTGGTTNCYQASGLAVEAFANTRVGAWANGADLARVASTAACDSTAGSFYASSDTTSPITLYVHLAGNSNPGSQIDGYVEYAHRERGIDSASTTNTTLLGVSAQRVTGSDGAIRLGNVNNLLIGTYAQQCWQHCYYIQGGAPPYATYVKNAEAYDGGFGMFVFHQGNGAGYSAVCDGCYAHCPTLDTTHGSQGFYAHTSGTAGQNFDRIAYLNPVVTNAQACLGAQNSAVLEVENPTCTTGFDGIIPASVINIINGGTVNANGQRAIDNGAPGVPYAVTVTSTALAGVVFVNNPNVTLTLTNVTFSGTAGFWLQNSGGAAGNAWTLSGNTYPYVAGRPTYYFPVVPAFASDNNSFGNASATFTIGGTTYNSLSAYRNATGQDAHSTP